MNSLILLFALTFTSLFVSAQISILGKWKTVDDNSGQAKSIVEIGERQGKVYGKVIKIFIKQGEDPDPVCDKCSMEDPRFNKKVIGMEILQEMVKDNEEFSGGNILDPDVGKVYRCKIWLEGNELKIRGYIGPFFRTQTWLRFVP